MASESYKWNDKGHVRTDAFLYSPWVEVPGKYGTSIVKFDVWHADYADELDIGYQIEGDSEIHWIKTYGLYYEPTNWKNVKCEISAVESQKLKGQNIRFVIRHLYDEKLKNGAAVYIDSFKYIYRDTYGSVEHVDISGWSAPTPNGTPTFLNELETEDPSYYVQYIKWHRNGGSFTKFEPGYTYWAEICVIPTSDNSVFRYTGKKGLDQFSDGVFLNEDTDFIDFEKSQVFLPDSRESHARLLIVTEKIELPLYDVLELNGTPVPIVGQSASGTPTRVCSAKSSDYTVLSANWYKHSGGSYTEYNGTFKEGEKYTLKVVIAPRGYTTINSGAVVKTTLGDATGTLDKSGRYTVYLPDMTAKVTANLKRGKCGDCTWTFDAASGQMIVSGTGEFYPAVCQDPDCSFYDYEGDVRSLIIEEGVTSIGDSTFMNCNELEKVWLADTITEISYDCFQWCDNLTEVKLPANLEYVGNGSFSGIYITELTLPDSLRVIDKGAFWYLPELTSLTLNEGLEEIGAWAFSGCISLSGDIYIPKSLLKLGDNTFDVDDSGNVMYKQTLHVYPASPAAIYAFDHYMRFEEYEDTINACHVTGDGYPFEPEIRGSNRFDYKGESDCIASITLYSDRALDNVTFRVAQFSNADMSSFTDEDGDKYYCYDESFVFNNYDCTLTLDGPGEFTIIYDNRDPFITVVGDNVVENIYEAIDYVYVNGYSEPKAGETAGANLDSIYVSDDENYVIDKLPWNLADGSETLSYSDKFEAGKEYALLVKLTPKSGFRFADDGVWLYVNGYNSFIDYDHSYYSSSYVYLYLKPVKITSGTELKGDVNGDGEVNNKDVVTLFRFVSAKNSEYDEKYDFNGDGEVNNKDVVELFRSLREQGEIRIKNQELRIQKTRRKALITIEKRRLGAVFFQSHSFAAKPQIITRVSAHNSYFYALICLNRATTSLLFTLPSPL